MEKSEEDIYDPYEHRTVPRPVPNVATFMNIFKGALGTGILALPHAFTHSGYVPGFALTPIIAAVLVYSLNLYLRSSYLICMKKKVPGLTYAETMKEGMRDGPELMHRFAVPFEYMSLAFFVIYQGGTCVVYTVFIGENIKQLFEENVISWDVRIWEAILLVPFLLLALIPDLKKIAPFSLAANVFILTALCILLYYIFIDLPSLNERDPVVSVLRLPLYLGISLFAISPIGMVVSAEYNMKNPRDFVGPFGILSIAVMLLSLIYAVFGFLGYWRYGDEAKASITLNIPQDQWPAICARVLYVISIIFSYTLNAYVILDLVWNQRMKQKYDENPRRQTLYEYIFRFGIVIITVLLAIAIPNLSIVISVMGVLCVCLLCFVFPPILDYCVRWPDKLGRLKWVVIRDVALFLYGILALTCGMAACVKDIIEFYKGE